ARPYAEFAEGENSKIYDKTEFFYRYYTVMQRLQRSYGVTDGRDDDMLQPGALKSRLDAAKVAALEEKGTTATAKEQKALADYYKQKPVYEDILAKLKAAVTEQKWLSPATFGPVLEQVLEGAVTDKKLLDKIMDGLS